MRERLEGMGIFVGVACAFFVIGVLALLLELQSPSIVLWNGIKLQGYTQQGLTYYHYKGELYAVDNTHASVADTRRVPTTVWLSRDDPTDSNRTYIENGWTRWTDFGLVVGWFVIGLAMLTAGFLRKFLRRRRRIEMMGQFGGGISDHLVRELLENRRKVPRVEFNPDE